MLEGRAAPPAFAITLLVGLVAGGLQAAAMLNPDFVVVDCEERFNAAHGAVLAHGHWDALLDLQYRRFCGGCTATAAAAGLVFSALPASFAAWKIVPIAVFAAIAAVGFRGLWQTEGRVGAWLFALLCWLPPLNTVKLGLLAWGNHQEAGLWVLLLLIGAGRAGGRLRLGLLAGFALWFGFSSVFAALALALGELGEGRRRGLLRFGLGLGLAPALWGLQWALTHAHPFGHIYQPGEAIPALSRAPEKLLTLLAPQQWAGLFGLPRPELGVPLGGLWLLALLVAALRSRSGLGRRAAAWLGLWGLIYLLVGFKLELLPWPAVASAAGLRYFGPLMPLCWVVLAAAGARLVRGGRRGPAVLLLAPALLVGLLSRAASFSPPWPSAAVFGLEAADHAYFRYVASYALDAEDHVECASPDEDHQALHAFARGRAAALGRAVNDPLDDLAARAGEPAAFWEGCGQALIDALDADADGDLRRLAALQRWIAPLPAEAQGPALAEAVWWRAFREEPYGYARGPAGEARVLRRLLEATAELDPALRDAALRSLGRRWGLVRARWGQPGDLDGLLPGSGTVEAAAVVPFVEGLGEGLGQKWGPVDDRQLTGLKGDLRAALVRGLATGAARQWSSGAEPAPLRADQREDRWWGPPPTMYCPCDATCW